MTDLLLEFSVDAKQFAEGADPDFWPWLLVAGVARRRGATSGCLVDAGSLRFLREVRGSRVVRRSCPGVARVGQPVAQTMNE